MKSYYSNEQWSQWLTQLAEDNFIVVDGFFPEQLLSKVLIFFDQKRMEEEFKEAMIGPATDQMRISSIRNDQTFRIDKNRDDELSSFFSLVEELKTAIAQHLFLSLNGHEFHLASYSKGGFYKAHLDQFDSRSNRMISLIVYLNEDWKKGDGGELKLHHPSRLVEPILNRAVIFRSDVVLHEVLPAQKERRSLTGWLLKQPSNIGILGI